MAFNDLTPYEELIIEKKGTERPFSGEYNDFFEPGIFICRKCNLPLFSSKAKFEAHCGWPAFDDEFTNSLVRTMAEDGERVEISCSNCGAHLGHVFKAEGFTKKNTRHCVNSISLKFIPSNKPMPDVVHE